MYKWIVTTAPLYTNKSWTKHFLNYNTGTVYITCIHIAVSYNYIYDHRLFSHKIISYLPCFLCRMISSNATIIMSDNIIIMHIASIDTNIAIKAVLLPSIDPTGIRVEVCSMYLSSILRIN